MPLNAKLHIDTVYCLGRTILRKSFASQPFRLANITEDRGREFLELMLMNASPGTLDGDAYYFDIHVGEQASVQLHTQSFQRLFTMRNGASQEIDLWLEEDAAFIYLPHPVVPHRNSSFSSSNHIHLKAKSTLVWGEVISCGRKENGEIFAFSRYRNITEIFLDQKLIVRDNILLNPAVMDPTSIGLLEGYTHQASLIGIFPKLNVEEMIAVIQEKLKNEDNIAFGVSSLDANGLVIRILGYKAEQLFGILTEVGGFLKKCVSKKDREIHVI